MNVIVLFALLFNSSLASAAEAAADVNRCPISLDLSHEERGALIGFNSRLSHLNNYYGQPGFQVKMNQLIGLEWPEDQVIDISPTLMERSLNLTAQHQLRDSIAATIGLDHNLWVQFDRIMRRVTFHTGLTENKHGGFTRKFEALVQGINMLNSRTMKTKNITREQQNDLKALAIVRVTDMFQYLERWSELNRQISKDRAAAAGRQFLFNMIGATAGGVLVASIIYSTPIVAGAGTLAAALGGTNPVVAAYLIKIGLDAANLIKLGQVVGGMAMGAVGAPVALTLTDTTTAVLEAQRRSANFGTVYACELHQQFEGWRQRGVSPYMKAVLVGGGLGFFGGALTLVPHGARVVLLGTTFGVGIAQAYTLGEISDNTMHSLAEYRLALDAHAAGDNPTARIHLQNSRRYAQLANEALLETIIVGALSASIATSFKTALIEGETAIRVVFANSSDTLPLAFGIAAEAAGFTR